MGCGGPWAARMPSPQGAWCAAALWIVANMLRRPDGMRPSLGMRRSRRHHGMPRCHGMRASPMGSSDLQGRMACGGSMACGHPSGCGDPTGCRHPMRCGDPWPCRDPMGYGYVGRAGCEGDRPQRVAHAHARRRSRQQRADEDANRSCRWLGSHSSRQSLQIVGEHWTTQEIDARTELLPQTGASVGRASAPLPPKAPWMRAFVFAVQEALAAFLFEPLTPVHRRLPSDAELLSIHAAEAAAAPRSPRRAAKWRGEGGSVSRVGIAKLRPAHRLPQRRKVVCNEMLGACTGLSLACSRFPGQRGRQEGRQEPPSLDSPLSDNPLDDAIASNPYRRSWIKPSSAAFRSPHITSCYVGQISPKSDQGAAFSHRKCRFVVGLGKIS